MVNAFLKYIKHEVHFEAHNHRCAKFAAGARHLPRSRECCVCPAALVTGWLSDRFPHRNIVVTGAVMAAAGFATAAFASDIHVVILGYGVLAGGAHTRLRRWECYFLRGGGGHAFSEAQENPSNASR